jgi:hypothetical protein
MTVLYNGAELAPMTANAAGIIDVTTINSQAANIFWHAKRMYYQLRTFFPSFHDWDSFNLKVKVSSSSFQGQP